MPEDAPQRYAELERAYVEERWSNLRSSGEALLSDLNESDDPQAEALANRVHLLMGHTHLYWLDEPDVAEDHYRAVLAGNAETELRRIASEGLEQCLQPPAAQTPASEAVQAAAAPEAAEPAAETPAATGTPLPDAGGDSGAASAAAAAAAAAGAGAGASITTAAASSADPFQAAVVAAAGSGAAAQSGSQPAMPWLQERPAAGGALVPRLEVEVVEEPELIEVAQADPALAEELELELNRIREPRAAERATADPFAAAVAAARAEVAAHPEAATWQEPDGESEGPPLELEAPTLHSEAGGGAAESTAAEAGGARAISPQVAAPELSAGGTTTEAVEAPGLESPGEVSTAAGASGAPDLSLEDPELVAGLLRVVLSP